MVGVQNGMGAGRWDTPVQLGVAQQVLQLDSLDLVVVQMQFVQSLR